MWVEQAPLPKPSNCVEIPIIEGMPSCGSGGEVRDPGPDSEHYPFRASFTREVLRQCGIGGHLQPIPGPGCWRIHAANDPAGESVLINNHIDLRTAPRQSSLYMVRRTPECSEARVKRVFFTAGSAALTLQSDNPAFRPISVPIEGIRIAGPHPGKGLLVRAAPPGSAPPQPGLVADIPGQKSDEDAPKQSPNPDISGPKC